MAYLLYYRGLHMGCTPCLTVQKGVPEFGDLERIVFVGTQLVCGA